MQTTYHHPFSIMLRNIWSLILREMRTRFGSQTLGFLWAVLEPIGMIAVLALIFSTGLKDRSPALGDSYILFFATGMVPYQAYRSVYSGINRAAKAGRNLLYFPILKPIDTYLASMILDALVMTVVLWLVFFAYYAVYETGFPDDWIMTVVPFFYSAVIGFSVGVINLSITSVFGTWQKIFKMLNRPMFFISGILFIAESLPKKFQDFLYYNPILHITELTRMGYFPNFESSFFDPYYLNAFTLGILFIALLMERAMRRKVLSRA